jgi:two-component system, sensor histidine kinase and response regulator
MDIQMPVLDGYSAARHIRKAEGSGRRTPIIAVTADALSGQRERCLAAGMDDVLTKQLDIALLAATLQRLMPQREAAPPTDGLRTTAPLASGVQEHSSAIDLAQLGELTDGDPEFATSLSEAFESSVAQTLEDLRLHVANADGTRLRQAAHKLAGASAGVYAMRLREYCKLLELQSEGMTGEEISAHIERITVEIMSAREELRRHLIAIRSAA